MMKHKYNRFIFLNYAFHFYDPLYLDFQYFIILHLTFANKIRNEKATQLFQLFKNQHFEKMLVFFCIKTKDAVKQSLKYFPAQHGCRCALIGHFTYVLQKIAIKQSINYT